MPSVNNGQTGAFQVASTQLSQEFFVDTSVLNYLDAIPKLLTQGAPRALICLEQTSGAVPGTAQLEIGIANATAAQATIVWRPVGSPQLTPLNTPVTIEGNLPTKFARVRITPPGGSNVVVRVDALFSQ